jgi:hypothetical protein
VANDQDSQNNQPQPETYKLTLEGGGVKVDRHVDEDVALQILAAVMGGRAPRLSSRMTAPFPSETPRPDRSRGLGDLSVREYMDDVEPKRKVEKILAIAGYLTNVREVDTFTPDDLKKEFRNAREPVPGNYARDFRWAVANGWLAPAADLPGEYYVTDRGQQALAAKFSDEIKKATGVDKTTRRRRTTKKGEDM